MLFHTKFIDGNFNTRLYKGDAEQTQTGSTTSTYNPAQQDFYNDLLDRSQSWLNNGGIQSTDYSQQMEGILGQQMNAYQDMMSGDYDRAALNNAMNANAQAATQQFQRNVLPTLNTQANMSGQAGSSRAGIAEGLATSDLNQQIANQNASMIWNAEQQAQQRKMAGAQGMAGLLQGYNQLGQYQNQLQNLPLESLLTYKNLIGGNMGGTERNQTTGTAVTEGSGGFI